MRYSLDIRDRLFDLMPDIIAEAYIQGKTRLMYQLQPFCYPLPHRDLNRKPLTSAERDDIVRQLIGKIDEIIRKRHPLRLVSCEAIMYVDSETLTPCLYFRLTHNGCCPAFGK